MFRRDSVAVFQYSSPKICFLICDWNQNP